MGNKDDRLNGSGSSGSDANGPVIVIKPGSKGSLQVFKKEPPLKKEPQM